MTLSQLLSDTRRAAYEHAYEAAADAGLGPTNCSAVARTFTQRVFNKQLHGDALHNMLASLIHKHRTPVKEDAQ